jgi:hypothetical protein
VGARGNVCAVVLICLGLSPYNASHALTEKVRSTQNDASMLIEAPGADLVRGHCSACHSLALVTAQRGDKTFWLNTIRWMQRTQNLWPLPAEHEAAILNYLSQHYAETQWGRRPNLSPSLMPGH